MPAVTWDDTGKVIDIESPYSHFSPLSPNPTKWSNTNSSLAIADELFECAWPFWGVAV